MDLSTRCGVRSRPSRFGSSPSRPSRSSIKGAIGASSGLGFMILTTALFDFICTDFEDVSSGLSDADFLQLRPLARKHFFPISLQPPANLETKIFRGRHRFAEGIHFRIQVAMVERLYHLSSHQFIEQDDIHS